MSLTSYRAAPPRAKIHENCERAPPHAPFVYQPQHHVATAASLEKAGRGGIVLSAKAGRVRTYRIAPGALSAVESWVAERKAKWNSHFDRLQQYLADQTRESAAEDAK